MIRPDSDTADAVKVRRTIANSRSVRTKDANTAHLLGLADGECRRAQAEGVVDTLEYTVERHDPGGHATADRYVLSSGLAVKSLFIRTETLSTMGPL